MNMKVLFITNHYLDQNFGGPNGSKGFINAFASIYSDMTLIYPDYDGSKITKYIPSSVHGIPCVDKRCVLEKFLDVYRGRINRFHSFLKLHLRANKYDIIIIDHIINWVGNTGTLVNTGSKLITIHHNVERYYMKDNPVNVLIRYPFIYYCNKAEKEAIAYSCLNLAHTIQDIKDYKLLYTKIGGPFYHLGAFEYRQLAKFIEEEKDKNVFIITGNLEYKQTVAPVLDFLQNYYPIMETLIPQSKLIIAGRNPNEEVIYECLKYNNVELIPNPEDMKPLLSKAGAYICPINKGSGQKMRVSDGLKSGLPVICHDVSVCGYEKQVEDGFILPYHDKDSFAKSLKTVISTKYDGQAIFDSYLSFFGIEAATERLRGILNAENLL